MSLHEDVDKWLNYLLDFFKIDIMTRAGFMGFKNHLIRGMEKNPEYSRKMLIYFRDQIDEILKKNPEPKEIISENAD